MFKFHFSLLIAIGGVILHAPMPLVAGPPPGEGYRLLVEENFDGPGVDETFWDYRVGRRGGEDTAAGWIDAFNRRENVTVAGGMLRIHHAREQIEGRWENTCGGLITKRRFGFGYYEARYRPLMLTSPGTHAAFWMMGINRQGRPGEDPTRPVKNTIFEIDSSEISSPSWLSTNNLYVAILPQGYRSSLWPHRMMKTIEPDAEGFVVDGFEYRPDGIIFYDNGREVGRTAYNLFQGQQEVWLTSLAGAHFRSMDASQLPGEALFDYFRYYAKDWPGANLLANPSFEYNMESVDPQHPVGWMEEGAAAASFVARGAARRDRALLRHAADGAYGVTTSQTLQHLLDGDYTATAWVRSSGGQRVARFFAGSPGEKPVAVDLPASAEWRLVELPRVRVTGHTVTVGFTSQAGAWQWLEVDDVRFMKPLAQGETAPDPPVFDVPGDPPYHLFPGGRQAFHDGRGYLFPRQTGSGESITVSFAIETAGAGRQTPIEKLPVEGGAGWSVQRSPEGDLEFWVGGAADHTVVVAPGAIPPGKLRRVACVFDRGEVILYVDGREEARRPGLTHRVDDETAPGTIGRYWTRLEQKPSFEGILGDIRVYNRAFDAAGIALLHAIPLEEARGAP